jgi:hypothetical protein
MNDAVRYNGTPFREQILDMGTLDVGSGIFSFRSIRPRLIGTKQICQRTQNEHCASLLEVITTSEFLIVLKFNFLTAELRSADRPT